MSGGWASSSSSGPVLSPSVPRACCSTLTPSTFVLLWNLRSLAFLSLVGGAGGMLFLMRNARDGRAAAIRTMLHLIWVFFVFLLLTAETIDYFRRLAVGRTKRHTLSCCFRD